MHTILAVCAAGFVVSAGRVIAGPVVYDSQSREIAARLSEQFPTGGVGIPASDEETAGAHDFGDWNAAVTAQIDNPPGGSSVGLSAISQQSRLADAGVTAGGTGSVQTGTVDGSSDIRAALDVTFTLDEAREFDLDFSFDASELDSGSADVVLSRVGGGTVFDGDLVFDFDDNVGEVVAAGGTTGTLEPGRYRFLFDYRTGGDLGADDLDYSVSLALTPADNGGPGRNPIPLPPAAWSALAATFVTLGGSRVLKLRRRRGAA